MYQPPLEPYFVIHKTTREHLWTGLARSPGDAKRKYFTERAELPRDHYWGPIDTDDAWDAAVQWVKAVPALALQAEKGGE